MLGAVADLAWRSRSPERFRRVLIDHSAEPELRAFASVGRGVSSFGSGSGVPAVYSFGTESLARTYRFAPTVNSMVLAKAQRVRPKIVSLRRVDGWQNFMARLLVR